MPKAMDHIVLNVDDMEKMLLFYIEIMGLSPERLGEFHSGKVPFPTLRINRDTVIDLFPRHLWIKKRSKVKGQPNLNHFCILFKKEEWDRLRRRLKDHKVVIEDGPGIRWGAHGMGISIYFQDPEKNLIEARYYK